MDLFTSLQAGEKGTLPSEQLEVFCPCLGVAGRLYRPRAPDCRAGEFTRPTGLLTGFLFSPRGCCERVRESWELQSQSPWRSGFQGSPMPHTGSLHHETSQGLLQRGIWGSIAMPHCQHPCELFPQNKHLRTFSEIIPQLVWEGEAEFSFSLHQKFKQCVHELCHGRQSANTAGKTSA